MMVNKGRNM